MKRIAPTVLLALATCGSLLAQPGEDWRSSDGKVAFEQFDVFIDSGGQPLAAYQLTVSASRGTARIVGIEGGEPSVFKQPPYYDPKAIQQDRVILAAFSTEPAERLPSGRVRVASIHVQIQRGKEPQFNVKVQTAGGPDGQAITVQGSATERTGK